MNRLLICVLSAMAIGTWACDGGETSEQSSGELGEPGDTEVNNAGDSDNSPSVEPGDGSITSATVTPDGIYALTSARSNVGDCSEPGLEYEDARQYWYVGKGEIDGGTTVLVLEECEDVADCQNGLDSMLNGSWHASYYQSWVFSLATADGFEGTAAVVNAGTPDDEGMCYEYAVSRYTLEAQGDGLSLMVDKTTCDQYPPNADGDCTEDDAIAAAVGNPCLLRTDIAFERVAQ